MHMYHKKNNFYGGTGIVGAQAALGAGLAWKYSLTNGVNSPGNVAVALYGDGAANQGQLFEAFNIAALNKVPIIFVCENNHYGMGTPEARGSAHPVFYKRCEYMPGLRVDGMNVFAVEEATRWAKEWCLGGNGPIILEMDSYRYVGHSMSDPDTGYRTATDKKEVRDKRDTVVHLQKVITGAGVATKEELSKIDKEIKKGLEQQLALAEKGAPTDMAELTTDIYTTNDVMKAKSCQGTVYL
jgi:pyruvate dehydrogenase E1 component alpha subunit